MRKVRLFVSSPSDVSAERQRVENVVRRVQADYPDGIEIEVVLWEENFYSARSNFQEQIPSPADSDLVLCILWKRLGTALPSEFDRADGTSRTGTEYEFETAMEAALSGELPDILVYRKSAQITFSADHVDQERAELQSLEGFWRRWIQNEERQFTAGFKSFEEADQFEAMLEKDLRGWIKRHFHDVEWPESKGSPYRGLEAFEEEHAPNYFGRRRAIMAACDDQRGLGDLRQRFAQIRARKRFAAACIAFGIAARDLGGPERAVSACTKRGAEPAVEDGFGHREQALLMHSGDTFSPVFLRADLSGGVAQHQRLDPFGGHTRDLLRDHPAD